MYDTYAAKEVYNSVTKLIVKMQVRQVAGSEGQLEPVHQGWMSNPMPSMIAASVSIQNESFQVNFQRSNIRHRTTDFVGVKKQTHALLKLGNSGMNSQVATDLAENI